MSSVRLHCGVLEPILSVSLLSGGVVFEAESLSLRAGLLIGCCFRLYVGRFVPTVFVGSEFEVGFADESSGFC